MSQSDAALAVTKALAPVAPLPCDATGPVFAEPWQAQAFAMVVALNERGVFTWAEWVETFSAELSEHKAHDDGSHYYEYWLEALEHILIKKGYATHAVVDDLAAAWARAAEATPHGKPIELSNDPRRC